MIRRIISDLGRKSYEDKLNYIVKSGIGRLNDLIKDDMIPFCEIRNAYVHTGGRVSIDTLRKISKTKYKEKYVIDQLFWINKEDFTNWNQKVIKASNEIHTLIVNKSY